MEEKRRVLIVEDEKPLREVLKEKFEQKGFEVLTAENGKESIEILRAEGGVDIVLMDILMPEMDGFEAIKAIRADEELKDQSIIALTNLFDSETVSRVLIHNVFNYIVKSDNSLDQIIEKVKMHMMTL